MFMGSLTYFEDIENGQIYHSSFRSETKQFWQLPPLNVYLFTLTLKAPRKPASENVICLCSLLNILANFSNLFLHTDKQCDGHQYSQNNKEKLRGLAPWPLFSFLQYNLSYLSCVQNFKFVGKVVPEISLTKINAMAISIARTTKGNNSKGPGPMALIFFPTLQLVIFVMCTKFQVSR